MRALQAEAGGHVADQGQEDQAEQEVRDEQRWKRVQTRHQGLSTFRCCRSQLHCEGLQIHRAVDSERYTQTQPSCMSGLRHKSLLN